MEKGLVKHHEFNAHAIEQLAENRLKAGDYKIFDGNAQVITRTVINNVRYLVIANSDGDIILIDRKFENLLSKALGNKRID